MVDKLCYTFGSNWMYVRAYFICAVAYCIGLVDEESIMESTNVVLPNEVDLDKCISLNTVFAGARLDQAQLERLISACDKVQGDILSQVSFETDMNGLRIVKGTVEADVILTCQRCGNEFVQHLEFDFKFTPDYERAKACRVDLKYDFIELDEEGKLDLYNLIEDGLLLEIPSIPRHDEDDEACTRHGSEWSYGELDKEASVSPFAALAALKDSMNKDAK